MQNFVANTTFKSKELIKLAIKQGYRNIECGLDRGRTTNHLIKQINNEICFEIYVDCKLLHEFAVWVKDFGRIYIFNVDFENLSIIENKLLKIYENEIKNL